MSISFIRKHYSIDLKVGDEVRIKPSAETSLRGLSGKLIGSRGGYLKIVGKTWRGTFHPCDVERQRRSEK